MLLSFLAFLPTSSKGGLYVSLIYSILYVHSRSSHVDDHTRAMDGHILCMGFGTHDRCNLESWNVAIGNALSFILFCVSHLVQFGTMFGAVYAYAVSILLRYFHF